MSRTVTFHECPICGLEWETSEDVFHCEMACSRERRAEEDLASELEKRKETGAHRMTWDDLTEEELLKILAALLGK